MGTRFKGLSRLIPGLITSGLAVVLLSLQAFAPIERMVNNQVIRWHGAHGWDSRLVMISIDDKTIDQIGQFPISRDYYAELLKLLGKDRSSVVAFNLILSDSVASDSPPAGSILPDAGGDGTGNGTGSEIGNGIGNGIGGETGNGTGGGTGRVTNQSATVRLAKAMSQRGQVVLGQIWNSEGEAIKPVPILANAAIATGHLRLPIDRDGFTRSVEAFYRDVPALGVAAVQAYGLDHEWVDVPASLSNFQINWPGPISELTTLSLVDILSGAVPPDFFADRIIFVSYGVTAGHTPMRTPFNYRWPVPGGYMHLAVADNLLNRNWLRPPSDRIVLLLLLLGGPILSGLLFRWGWLVQLLTAFLLLIIWLLICMTALRIGYLLPVVSPVAVIFGTCLFVIIWRRLQSNALLQVRSAFLNTMSHEIRTPLNAIVNLSEMLQETPLSDRQKEYAETLQSSSQTLMALIDDVLDFSKIESGHMSIENYPVNIAETIERSIELLAPRAAEKSVELAYAIAPNVPAMIMSDPVRLQQILSNLLSNAVKFTAAGEVTVRVKARPYGQMQSLTGWQRLRQRIGSFIHAGPLSRSKASNTINTANSSAGQLAYPGRYELCFEVKDTGVGIPADRIPQLFKPFSQASASTTREYGGTGLGLAISKRLVERIGGDIWVKSTPGKGSQFYFTFQTRGTQAVLPPPKYLIGLRDTWLLIVDANLTRREQLTHSLKAVGIQSVQSKSLAEAWALARNMSTLDGLILDEAIIHSSADRSRSTAELRSIVSNFQGPIILLSTIKGDSDAITSESITDKAIADRAITLWKPVKQSALYQALRSIRPTTLSAAPKTLISRPTALTSRATLKILIAEDNRTNQRVALRLLEILGYRADLACTGAAVLAALKHQHYDVILMDMRMPEMDGVEATRQIRQMPQHRDIWIIAMTANAMDSDRKLCLSAGMDDYLRKPIKREALNQALERSPALQRSVLD